MAKEDFCFTYYDGDAARDMMHMNRTERGGYNDIILSQRKFGWLTLDQIKKILGRDFEEIWPAIEMAMIHDEGKYYIEWLDNSEQRAGAHSVKQSGNGKKGGRPPKNKPKQKPSETQIKPNDNPNLSQKKPLGDGDGDGNEEESKEGGMGETLEPVFDEPFKIELGVQLPPATLEAAEMNQFARTRNKNTEFLKQQWGVFVAERIHDPPARRQQYRELSDLTTHYLNWIRDKHPKNGKQGSAQIGRFFESD